MIASKKHVAQRVARKLAMSQEAAMGLVSVVVDAQREMLVEYGGVLIRGLGTFRVVEHAESRARNPQTQATVVVPAQRRAKFRPGKALRQALSD